MQESEPFILGSFRGYVVHYIAETDKIQTFNLTMGFEYSVTEFFETLEALKDDLDARRIIKNFQNIYILGGK